MRLTLVALAAVPLLAEQIPIHAPYVTTPPEVVRAMLRLAGVTPQDVVYDLGCGDGRIAIAAAREFGARSVGVDLSADRIEQARENARKAEVAGRVEFRQEDLFETDLGGATVVAIYLLADVNLSLRPKLLRELRRGARVVSHAFAMGAWKPEKSAVIDGNRIYLWRIGASDRMLGTGLWWTENPLERDSRAVYTGGFRDDRQGRVRSFGAAEGGGHVLRPLPARPLGRSPAPRH